MADVELPGIEATSDLVRHLQATSSGFGGLIERFGQAALAFRHVGLVQWQAGRFDGATEAFLAALSLHPEDPDLWRDLASVYSAVDKVDLAHSAISTSIVLDRRQPQSWLMLAGLLDRRDDLQKCGTRLPPRDRVGSDAGLGPFRARAFVVEAQGLRAGCKHARCGGRTWSRQRVCPGVSWACAVRQFRFRGQRQGLRDRRPIRGSRCGGPSEMGPGRDIPSNDRGKDRAGPARLSWSRRRRAGRARDDRARRLFSSERRRSLDAAAELGRLRLQQAPEDPVRRYLLEAVTGQPISAAPHDYIEAYFDSFAPQFDQKLVGTLHYNAPTLMVEQIARHRTQFNRILDAGCGTGLAADMLSQFGTVLIGLDLSSRMLDEAKKRERYAELIKSDIVAYLDQGAGPFDLVFAADVLIYFGDLSPFVAAAAGAMVSGGLLACCVEAGSETDYVLQPSGRFRHASPYIETLLAAHFDILESFEHDIRLEAGRPVSGLYLVAERR